MHFHNGSFVVPRGATALLIVLVLVIPGVLVVVPGAGADKLLVNPGTLPVQYASIVWTGTYAYIFGGYNSSTGYSASILRYDPATGSMTTMSATLPSPRFATSAVWDGTNAYIFGGADGTTWFNQIVKYTPSTDSSVWLYQSPLPTGRTFTSAIWDGAEAYVFGGLQSQFTNSALRDVLRFNPSTGAVVRDNSFPTARFGTSAVWDGTSAYIFGGGSTSGDGMNDIIRYRPSQNSVTKLTSSLPAPNYAATAVLQGHTGYIFGGIGGGAQIVSYNITSNAVAVMPTSLPSSRYSMISFSDGSNAYLLGGYLASSAAVGQILKYNPDIPLPPGIIQLTSGPGAGQISIVWQVPSTPTPVITAYRVYGGNAPRSESYIATVASSGPLTGHLAFTDTGLANGVVRYYVITAVNAAGESFVSPEASARTYIAPGAPGNVAAIGQPAMGTLLKWEMPSTPAPITDYRIYRATVPGQEALLIQVAGTQIRNLDSQDPVFTYSDGTCPTLATCFYRIAAGNVAGEGPLSLEVSAQSLGPIANAPSAPAPSEQLIANGGFEAGLAPWSPPGSVSIVSPGANGLGHALLIPSGCGVGIAQSVAPPITTHQDGRDWVVNASGDLALKFDASLTLNSGLDAGLGGQAVVVGVYGEGTSGGPFQEGGTLAQAMFFAHHGAAFTMEGGVPWEAGLSLGTGGVQAIETGPVPDGGWHHYEIDMSFASAQANFLIDGHVVASASGVPLPDVHVTNVYVGQGGCQRAGVAPEIRFDNIALDIIDPKSA